MKKLLALSLICTSAFAATDVDYSRCNSTNPFSGFYLDNTGTLVPANGMTIKSKKTRQNAEEYELSFQPTAGGLIGGGYGGLGTQPVSKAYTQKVKITRDDKGNVTQVQTGGKPDQDQVNSFKAMFGSGPYGMGMGMGFGNPYGGYGMSNPYAGGFGYSGFSGFGLSGGFGMGSSSYQMPTMSRNLEGEPIFFYKGSTIKLSDITKAEAPLIADIGTIESLNLLKKQWKRDQETQKKMREQYAKLLADSPVAMPAGSTVDYMIKDGACVPTKITDHQYNTKSKELIDTPRFTATDCEKIDGLVKKYSEDLEKCSATDRKVSADFQQGNISTGAKMVFLTSTLSQLQGMRTICEANRFSTAGVEPQRPSTPSPSTSR